jgi:hypothetical protein
MKVKSCDQHFVLAGGRVGLSIVGCSQFNRRSVACGLVPAVTVRGICAAGLHAGVAAVVGKA